MLLIHIAKALLPARRRCHKMMINCRKINRLGITMVEILVATTVFSLFMAAAFGILRSSQTGFESGSWRLHRQKEAQIFLIRLKEAMEKANHAYQIQPDGTTIRAANARPIYINSAWNNQLASPTNNGVMYFSISTPFVPAIPEMGQPLRPGIWKGVGLECVNNTIRCYLTGDWNRMPPFTPVDVGTADVGRFVLGNLQGDFSVSVSDVQGIGVFVQTATGTAVLGRPEVFVTVRLMFQKPRSRAIIQFTEQITARVQDRTLAEIIAAPVGSYNL